jgi:hypothetical protein
MRIFQDVVVEQHTEQRYTHSICDACGVKIESKPNSAFESVMYMKEGTEDADGGQGTMIEFTFCENCLRNSIIPVLRKLGPSAKWEAWEW